MYYILALDLEGTLISNAMSQLPRPGLFEFLSTVKKAFPRVVMFTTISESKFRSIANLLVKEGTAPEWFYEIEYINWDGTYKDLSLIPRGNISSTLILDDFVGYIHPEQHENWIEIENYGQPYDQTDRALEEAWNKIKSKL
ncbi:hypothetical protein CXF86_19550 [Shewanella sp. GutCb]|uniref:NIF family HAD-type phosphatase n=1 Tax=Shewanella sp. GutCb TaxID=2058315 RepID=UPI000C7C8805|nr:NIF family HAD-type phosphatase [Shewanella sp. GutCb]PKG73073.1 hypothetical protein CXF86_19550 [Shewanella sp. GutCb]